MIAIDGATILQIKGTIELPFQSSLTMFVIQWQQGNLAKSVLYVETFGLLIYPDAFLFSCFCCWCGCVELASNITMQHNNLDMRQFCLIWFKTRDKIDICSYPYRKQHFLLSYLKTLNVGPAGVWTHGLLLSSTSSSNWANQVWEKLKQGCYQGSNPGPWAPKAMPPLSLQSLVTC